MARRPLHLPSALSMLVLLATAGLWVRARGGGDHVGWSRQHPDGRTWVREEWSIHSLGGRLEFLSQRRALGGSPGDAPAKAQIRNGDNGFFWRAAVEPRRATAKATPRFAEVTAAEPYVAPPEAPAKTFAVVNENTGMTRSRGATLPHWLILAVAAALPARWLFVTMLRRRDAPADSDRVSVSARLFATVASASILLALALCGLWLKSWYVGDRVSWRDSRRPQFVDVHSGKGELVLHFRRVDERLIRSTPDLASAPNGLHWRQDADAGVGYTARTFCFEHDNRSTKDGASRALTVAAPYWFVVVLALVPPMVWVRRQKNGPVRVMSFGREARSGGRGGSGGRLAPINQRPI